MTCRGPVLANHQEQVITSSRARRAERQKRTSKVLDTLSIESGRSMLPFPFDYFWHHALHIILNIDLTLHCNFSDVYGPSTTAITFLNGIAHHGDGCL